MRMASRSRTGAGFHHSTDIRGRLWPGRCQSEGVEEIDALFVESRELGADGAEGFQAA